MQTDRPFIIRQNCLFYMVLVALLFACSCDSYKTLAEKRAKRAARSRDILIGIVDTRTSPSLFAQGVRLAIKELNQKGGVLGKRIRPIFHDDEGSVRKGQRIAADLAENPDVIAVVGHRDSSVAISASIAYEESGMVFISHGATETALVRNTNVFVFRNIPSDKDTAHEMAAFARRNGYGKMAVIYDRRPANKRLADCFYEYAVDSGIDIVGVKSYSEWEEDFRLLIADLIKEHPFDAIFLGGGIPGGANLIRQTRAMGVTAPILSGSHLDSQELFNIAGKGAEGVIVPTVFDPNHIRTPTREFVKRFQSETSVVPDTWAAQGYDAVQVLAFAIKKGESAVPVVISTTLRSLGNWEGVTGKYAFARDGNITGKSIFFKKVRNGNFEFLERGLRTGISLFEELEDITLRIPLGQDVPTIDPAFVKTDASAEIAEQLFLGLTDFEPGTYQVVPELAEDWTSSADSRAWHFKMRQDALWTDGAPVTAHDVVWAIQRNIRPETRCPTAHNLHILKNAREIHGNEMADPSQIGVRAIDDFTLAFELEHPAVHFPAMAGLPAYRPVRKDVVGTYPDRWTEPENIQTNGSYALAAWEKGMVMILRRNPKYYDYENVAVPEIRYHVLRESSAGLAMYGNNRFDIMGSSYLPVPRTEIPNMPTSAFANEYSREPVLCTYSYLLNASLPPLDKVLVRKAISAAIDQSLLMGTVIKEGHEPATTFVRPPAFGAVRPETGIGTRFDPIQAKKWLAQAGYPDARGLPEMTLFFNSEAHARIAQAVQSFLRHYLNMNIRLAHQEGDGQSLTGHIIPFERCADYPDANSWFSALLNLPDTGIGADLKHSEFAEQIRQAQEEPDAKKRKHGYERAEQILCEEECLLVPIYFETTSCLVKPRVKGWHHMPTGGQHVRDWSLEQ